MNIKITHFFVAGLLIATLLLGACTPPPEESIVLELPTETPIVETAPNIITLNEILKAFYSVEGCNASPISLGVLVNDANLKSVSLYYRFTNSAIGATETKTIELAADSQNRFIYNFANNSADFGILHSQDGILEYYFVATDSTGNSTRYPVKSWAQISLLPCAKTVDAENSLSDTVTDTVSDSNAKSATPTPTPAPAASNNKGNSNNNDGLTGGVDPNPGSVLCESCVPADGGDGNTIGGDTTGGGTITIIGSQPSEPTPACIFGISC